MGRVVPGVSCPWGELSMGELSMGRVFYWASCRGASFDGASCPWGELSWGEWSGNPYVRLRSRYLKVHMHEILKFVFLNFLASFNNRQGRGPEFQKFC
jgi:hypothetical protein